MTCGYGPFNYGECSCGVQDGLFDLYFRRQLGAGGYDTDDVIGLARYPSIHPIGHTNDVDYDSSESPNRPWSIPTAMANIGGLETRFAYHGGGAGGSEKIWCLEKRFNSSTSSTSYCMTLYNAVTQQELWNTNVDSYFNESFTGSLGIYRTSGQPQGPNAPFLHRLSIGDSGMRSCTSAGLFEMNSSGTIVHGNTSIGTPPILAPRMFPYAASNDGSGAFYAEYQYDSGVLAPGTKTHFGSGNSVQQFDMNPYGYAAICGTGTANQVGVWVDGTLVATISLSNSDGRVWSVHRAFNATPYACVCYQVGLTDHRVKIFSGSTTLWTSGAMAARCICDMSSDRWFYIRGPEFNGFGADFDPILATGVSGLTQPWPTTSTDYHGFMVKHDASQAVAAGTWVFSSGAYRITDYNATPDPILVHSRCDCVHNSSAVGGNVPADASTIDPTLD